MPTLVTIGDFSRMTYLSVKALRHYHEIGLLEPVEVDFGSGYRRYDTAQVTTAQVIRRFRELGMPLDRIQAVIKAPDLKTRNRIIVAHLESMEQALDQTQAAVSSLRRLLERPPSPLPVEYRTVASTAALAIAEPVSMSAAETWWSEAFDELYGVVRAAGLEPAGPAGVLYSAEFFELERGPVTAFVPLTGDIEETGRAHPLEIPAAELAIALHEGPFGELDQTYGALGTFVAERAVGIEGPIRENYLVSAIDTADEAAHRTEVCWPIFRTHDAHEPRPEAAP